MSAALEVQRSGGTAIVLEAGAQVGGKVRLSEVGGVTVDEGADSMLRRVPYGVDLATAAGFALVSPVVAEASLWTRGRLRPLPTGTVMGIPADLAALARSEVLSSAGLARVPWDLAKSGEPLTEDISVGDLVTRRLGREVVQRLVDPLLGGVYAGRADLLSLQATLPQLWPGVQRHRSLIVAAREARGVPSTDPVFAGIAGGLGHLPPALAAGLDVRLRSTVRALTRTEAGWRVETGSAADPSYLEVDAVVLAVPAAAAARLLAGHVPVEELGRVHYASVAIVTLVLDGPSPGQGSGYLVPAIEGRVTKAVTFASRKWGRPGPAVLRASVGRYGEEIDLQRDDDELVAVVLEELRAAVGPVPQVLDSRVTRWGGGLPQYAVGHLDVVRRLRASLPGGLAVAGAAYDGVGVPAVAKSGQDAARVLLP